MTDETLVTFILPVSRARELALAAQRGAGHTYTNRDQVARDALYVLGVADAAERADE